MSNLRIIGLIIGALGLYLTFRIYRGPKWKKTNFLFFGIISLFLLIISLYPDLLNMLAGTLALDQEHRGRLLFLLIASNILLWFSLMYLLTKTDKQNYQFDLLIRNLGRQKLKNQLIKDMASKKIMVIIPAFNEGVNLKELLTRMPEKINQQKLGVLVIDDGSNDKTSEIVKKSGHLVTKNIINRGQGAASRLGYDILLRQANIKVGVTMDADNQHRPEEIKRLVAPILKDNYDLVIGSRNLNTKKTKYSLRRLGMPIFSGIINFLTGLNLTDCSSGFKAFNIEKMRQLNLKEDQFQAAEVIIEAAKKGLRIKEVAITPCQRKYGQTKKGKEWRYAINFAKTILKSWWR